MPDPVNPSQLDSTHSSAPRAQHPASETAPNQAGGTSHAAKSDAHAASRIPLVTADTPPNKKRLVGENYTTPDLIAKVTGRSKYAEDYRADGMLFTKLLLSPYPHARVLSIDSSEALAMPGVKAVITMDDLPAPADAVTDLGVVIKANKRGERGLAMEPVYQGETRACSWLPWTSSPPPTPSKKSKFPYEPLPFVVDPFVSLRPGSPNARTDGNTWMRPPAQGKGGPPPPLDVTEIKWTGRRFQGLRSGQDADGQAHRPMDLRRRRRRIQKRGSRSRRDFHDAQHRSSMLGNAHRDGLLAGSKTLHPCRHAKHHPDCSRHRALDEYGSRRRGFYQRVHRRRVRKQNHRLHSRHHSRHSLQKVRRARYDAHHPRGRALHRQRAAQRHRTPQSRIRQRWPHHRRGHVFGLRQRPLRSRWAIAECLAASFRCSTRCPPCAGGESTCSPIRRRAPRKVRQVECRASP